jgi:hypothetical protein
MTYEESGFRFAFGPSWRHIERWDACRAYQDGIGTLQGDLDGRAESTKAVDFVAVHDRDIWLFEIKDFRNRPIEHKVRSNELPLEVALKVRDTVAGIVGRHRSHATESWIAPAVARLLDHATSLTVIALIASPGPWRSLPEHKRKAIEDVVMKKTRQRLAWLTREVYVLDPSDSGRIPDLKVTPLAQR